MPPRSGRTILSGPRRADVLRHLLTTERELRDLRLLPVEEAVQKIERWHDDEVRWIERRTAFLEAEMQSGEES